MDTDRWQEIEGLFHDALELAPGERPEFLARACGGDAELRGEVESLLAASGGADERIGGAMTEALELALDADGSPEHLGPYQVVRKIGEGGLATVYLGASFIEREAGRFVLVGVGAVLASAGLYALYRRVLGYRRPEGP